MHLIKIHAFTHTSHVTKYSPYEICMCSWASCEAWDFKVGSGLYAQDSSEDLQKVCMLITNYHQLHDCEYHSMMIVHDHNIPIVYSVYECIVL